ncbi:MAG: protease HtpX [Coxiellaceae bacterium]|nr:MAG: protease HtpX [Coxiellaceae bacterium]
MMGKRVLLFLATNLLVIVTISIVTSLLGLHNYLSAHGIDYKTLAIFCAIWGTGGAFISLLMSKFIAKTAMGVQVIDPNTATGEQRALVEIVYKLSRKVGLTKMPEVGIYDSPELNVFATGPSKNNSLVAVSSGLLHGMNPQEVEGVLGHEVSHVANGDMVTMTLIQGVINAFAMFLSRIIAYAISMAMSRGDNEREEGGFSFMTFYLLTMVFDVLFTLLGSIVVAAFSRWREYRADAGGARLAGRENMIQALQRLQSYQDVQDPRAPSLAALKISHKAGILALFSSHPPIPDRIERLQKCH